jgi:glutaredoxin
MNKIIIYTNKNCPYCKSVKEELKNSKIHFVERVTADWPEVWNDITSLTNMPSVPTIQLKDDYLVPGRDFNNPKNLVSIIENYDNIKYGYDRQALERLKTLNYNMGMAFTRLDQLLQQIENKLNINDKENNK